MVIVFLIEGFNCSEGSSVRDSKSSPIGCKGTPVVSAITGAAVFGVDCRRADSLLPRVLHARAEPDAVVGRAGDAARLRHDARPLRQRPLPRHRLRPPDRHRRHAPPRPPWLGALQGAANIGHPPVRGEPPDARHPRRQRDRPARVGNVPRGRDDARLLRDHLRHVLLPFARGRVRRRRVLIGHVHVWQRLLS